MNHYWSISELEDRQDVILNMLKPNDENYSNNLLTEYNMIDEMIALTKKRKFSFSRNKIKFVDKKKFLTEENFAHYLEMEKEYKELIRRAVKEIINLEYVNYDVKLDKSNLSEEELFNMARDFYANLPTSNRKFVNSFDRYTNVNLHNINFGDTSSDDEFGSTYLLYYPNYKPYIIVKKTNTYEDFVSLAHEIAHAIYSKPNNPDGSYTCFGELMELEGCFFNFLANNYLKEYGRIQDYEKLAYLQTYSAYDYMLDAYILSIIYDIFTDYSVVDKKEIVNRIKNDGVNIRLTNYILRTTSRKSIATNFLYFFNHMISTDLEKICEVDPEKAFYLFDKIKTSNGDNCLDLLRKNEITFMDDGFKNFNEKILSYNKMKKV